MKILENLVDKRAGYSEANLVKALFLISKGAIGRPTLMKRLNLTEAPVKTMLKSLTKGRLIKSGIEGAFLTDRGRGLTKKILRRIPKLPIEIKTKTYADYGLYKKMYKHRYDFAILVKGIAHKIRDGVEQRDNAVKSGAIGATTLIQKKQAIMFPLNRYKIDSAFSNYLRKNFDVRDSDAVIICFGPSRSKAENSAISVALSLI